MSTATMPEYFLHQSANYGYGEEHDRIKGEIEKVRNDWDLSIFHTGSAQSAISDLRTLARRAQRDNWDGEAGNRISELAYLYAERLLENWSKHWPSPEVDLDRTGEVSFRWNDAPGKRLTVTVTSRGTLAYAWMKPDPDGGFERNYGVAQNQGIFPDTLAQVLSSFDA